MQLSALRNFIVRGLMKEEEQRLSTSSKTTKAWAAQSATVPLAPFAIDRRDPLENDVAIDILYCGVCHSDLHQARNEWQNSIYPVVPGHEIVGRIVKTGKGVKRFPGRRSRSCRLHG